MGRKGTSRYCSSSFLASRFFHDFMMDGDLGNENFLPLRDFFISMFHYSDSKDARVLVRVEK